MKPTLTNFSQVAPVLVQQYERYLPTAFDESLSILEKINKVIEYMNRVGDLSANVVEKWNEVMEWVMNEGLSGAVMARLDQMVQDGTFDSIINQELLNSKSTIVLSKNEPSTITLDKSTYWYKEV